MYYLSVNISDIDSGRTVETVLKERYSVSESYLRRLKRRPGALLLNGEPVYTTHLLKEGDVVSFDPADEHKLPIRPISFSLSIVFEDDWLIVLNKPKNFSVHPARDPNEPTVENALSAYLSGTDNPHPVTRLDKGTTGLLTVAKSGYLHARMKEIQHNGLFRKSYLAILCGVPKEQSFLIDASIGAFPGSTYRRTVREDGAQARTFCEVLAVRNGLSLARLTPYTGRTHQLRVHMAYAGYPLYGDWLYGERSEGIDRPALHASELVFDHPITHEMISLSAPLPEDMRRFFP